VEFPGAIHHVTSRMIGGRDAGGNRLFRDAADYERYLERLEERVADFSIRLFLFCLMRTHVHLVFETPEGNLSRFMQSLSTAYTVYYNLRHDRHGHLLDGRFKGKLVDGDAYLLNLSRYVHLNPVRDSPWETQPLAEQMRRVRDYPWSSFSGYVSRRRELPFVTYGPVLGLTNAPPRHQRTRYRRFVETGLATRDEEFEAALRASPLSVGGDAFRRQIDEMYQGLSAGRGQPQDVSFRRVTETLAPERVLGVVAEVLAADEAAFRERRRDSLLRAVACQCLVRYAGMTQREVATFLEMGSGAAVSNQLLRLRREEGDSTRRVRSAFAEINRRLREIKAGS
jgi:REP element-mobilizing transposase RayT